MLIKLTTLNDESICIDPLDIKKVMEGYIGGRPVTWVITKSGKIHVVLESDAQIQFYCCAEDDDFAVLPKSAESGSDVLPESDSDLFPF